MAGDDTDLMLLGEGGQLLGHGAGPRGVEVDEHVVHDQRQGNAAASELRGEPQPEAEIKLLGRATTQFLGTLMLRGAVENNEVLAIFILENPLVGAGCHPREGAGGFLEYSGLARGGEVLQSAGDQLLR